MKKFTGLIGFQRRVSTTNELLFLFISMAFIFQDDEHFLNWIAL